jgi:hypothetical protein
MVKSTINEPFSIAMLNYQRVIADNLWVHLIHRSFACDKLRILKVLFEDAILRNL